jgi:type IV secretion system protein VirB6
MSGVCTAAPSGDGVAVLISTYLDCQARTLGENGFQALAGGALGTSILSGLVTIFVAFVGYRFVLGEAPGLREGVGRTARLGLVLALMTSWPAFQTLVYDVTIEGPRELAGVILPASGLPSQDLHGRVQRAYDTIRLGTADPQAGAAQAAADPEGEGGVQGYQFQPPLPRTAALFVISTAGFEAGLRVGAGFLLAIAPLAIMCLLFDATLGIFSGWVRAVGGMTLAALAATIVTAMSLVLVEGELGRLQALRFAGSREAIDPQALSVIVILFAIVMLVTVIAAARATSAFKLPLPWLAPLREPGSRPASLRQQAPAPAHQPVLPASAAIQASIPAQTRAAAIVGSLSSSVRREHLRTAAGGGSGATAATSVSPPMVEQLDGAHRTAARRGLGRRTRTSALRDRRS